MVYTQCTEYTTCVPYAEAKGTTVPSDAMIVTQGLRKSFGGTRVLDGIDLEVKRGEIFALLGPNGAGKTTAVNILTTLLKPDAGSASIAGVDVIRRPALARAALSLTGQFAAVDPFQSGAENLAMMARLAHLGRRAARRRTAELLGQFDLEDAAGRRAATYSGGMRRRLDLAISLIAAPPVVFLDEPTTGLDPRSRNQMWSVVRELTAAGTTILLTTQYLEEADQLADTVAVLNHGSMVATGTPADLKAGLSAGRVELAFENDAAFAEARALDFGIDAIFNAESCSVSVVTTDSVHTTRELLALADRHGLAVSNISLLKPTLDDVFLRLTGGARTTPLSNGAEEAAA
jgi:ABC-2 type transport system ATP-binding protein